MLKLQNLINELMTESVYDKGIFKAVFLTGLPGAGKSYTLSKITDGSIEPRIVNTDKYSEYFGKKLGIKDVGTEIRASFYDRVRIMTHTQLSQYINSMLPLFVDSTSSKINITLYRDGLLKLFGYDTAMVFVNTSFETAIKRIQQRERSVPISFVKDVYSRVEDNVKFYKNNFSTFIEINNDEGELNDEAINKAYKAVSAFFKGDIKNYTGKRNKKIAENSSGYLTPVVYKDISQIKAKLINW